MHTTAVMLPGSATEEKQDDLNELISLLTDKVEGGNTIARALLQVLRPLSLTSSGSGRLLIDVQNVAQVTTVSNQTNMGGVSAFDLQLNTGKITYANCIRRNLTF